MEKKRKYYSAEYKAEDLKLALMDKKVMRETVFEYIEIDYNRQRRHSLLGYLSPLNFELKNVA
jgi:transposase InsO family protein